MNEQDPVFWEWLRKKVREDQEKEAGVQQIQLEITVPMPTERDKEEQEKYDPYVDYSITPDTVYEF
ncbi:MAG: hypothetical protein WC761_01175 [Candidatus Paceibacterota bacterium]|jgi:hypothetical protein